MIFSHRPLTISSLVVPRPVFPKAPLKKHKTYESALSLCSLAHQFWKHFIGEYVLTPMPRSKWHTRVRHVRDGDIVLLVEFNAPRGKWNLALEKNIYLGADGVIRTVLFKANDSGVKSQPRSHPSQMVTRRIRYKHISWSKTLIGTKYNN